MRRILITGAGNLGLALGGYLLGRGIDSIALLSRREPGQPELPFYRGDVTDSSRLEGIFNDFIPEAVIHTAAMTDVDLCQKMSDEAMRVNAHGTENVVKLCQRSNIPLIYISTDFVFDGARGDYDEVDDAFPVNVYGRTKLAGERIVMKAALPWWAVIRTSFLYDPEGPNYDFVSYAVESLRTGNDIHSDDYRFCQPTPCPALGRPVEMLLNGEREGIFHLCGGEVLTPYRAALMVANALDLDAEKVHRRTAPPPERAPRPVNPGLDTGKAQRELSFDPPLLRKWVGRMYR